MCIGLHVLIWPFKFRWSRGYICNSSYHHHLIGSTNRSRRCHNFFHGYVPEVVVPSYAVGSTYIPGKLDCISLLMCSLMMCVNNRVYYGPMAVFVSLHIILPHYHHYVDVSECIELLICLPCTFCRVCVKDYVNCLNSLSSDDYGNTCTWFIIIVKTSFCHCLWLGNEIVVCTVYLSMFL